MATWDITFPAQSGYGGGSSWTDETDPITPPGDFDGATINSVSVVGSPTITSDGTTDDTVEVRFYIVDGTGTNVDIYGNPDTANQAICRAILGDSASSATITNDTNTTPAPTTAVAAEWNIAANAGIYTANMKSDGETVSWSSFTVRVDYTPASALDQDSYRISEYNSTESSPTWLAATNTAADVPEGGFFQVRILLQETAGGSWTTQLRWEYRINGGSWTLPSFATPTAVAPAIDTSLTDDSNTTQQIGSGTYDSTNAAVNSSTSPIFAANTISANNEVEVLFPVVLSSGASVPAAAGDTVEFRITTSTGGALSTYTRFATINVVSTGDNLLANNISSVSTVSTPAIAQTHDLLANNISSASTVSTPDLSEEQQLLADNISSATAVSTPTLSESNILLADNIQSASAVSTPTIAQTHDLLADNIQSASAVSAPTIAQDQQLLADNIQSASAVSTPSIGQEHVLLANNLQSATTVSTPALVEDTQNELLANNIQSASTVSTPTLVSGGTDALLANNVQSATAVSTPTVGQEHGLLAGDVQSATAVSTPSVGQEHGLLANNITSATTVSTPALTEDTNDNLLADNVSAATQVSSPAIAQTHDLLANNIQSASTVSIPTLAENFELLSPDADTTVGSWTTHTGATTNLYQQIDEYPANDTDYVRSELAPSTSAVRFSLSNPAAAPSTSDAQTVRYRYRKDDTNGQVINLTVRLIEGASTVIATWSHTDIGGTIVQANQPLSGAQKAAITNHDNLFLEFEANAP